MREFARFDDRAPHASRRSARSPSNWYDRYYRKRSSRVAKDDNTIMLISLFSNFYLTLKSLQFAEDAAEPDEILGVTVKDLADSENPIHRSYFLQSSLAT